MADDFKLELTPDLDKLVEKEKETIASCEDAANQVANIARANAPMLSGEYASSIQVQKTKAGWRVYASDFKSAWIEFGVPTLGQPARFVIRSAAVSAGLKFRKKGGG